MRLTKFKYFYPEKPRLLQYKQPLFQQFSKDPNWVAERKYNGTRLELHFIQGEFKFWGRHGSPLRYTPSPDLLEELKKLPLSKSYYSFDAELCDKKVKGVRDRVVFYDLHIYKGELLTTKPFWYRRELLETLFKRVGKAKNISLIEQFSGRFKPLFNRVIKNEAIEGLVLKNKQGMLNLGRTSAIESQWMYKVRKPSGRYHF